MIERVTNEDDQCQVSRLGLQRRVQNNEPLRDESDEILQRIDELDARYDAIEDVLWGKWHDLSEAERDRLSDEQRKAIRRKLALEERWRKLEDEIRPAVTSLRYLWSRTDAPNRTCPKCGFIPLDSQVRDCAIHGTPLRLIQHGGVV